MAEVQLKKIKSSFEERPSGTFSILSSTPKKIVELSKLRNMKMSTFSTALSCLGDTCKQGQKQAEEKNRRKKSFFFAKEISK